MGAYANHKKIAILATNGVDAIELGVVSEALTNAFFQTKLIGLSIDPIKTWSNKQWREEVFVDIPIEKANPSNYDGLFLPGGLQNADKLRTSKLIIAFITEIAKQHKPIAAICHAPWLLIDAGVVKGKKVTSYPSLKMDLENAGAIWLDEQVVRDTNLITSRRPDDVKAFSKQVVELFKE